MTKQELKRFLSSESDYNIVDFSGSFVTLENEQGELYSVGVNDLISLVNKLYLQYEDDDVEALIADEKQF